MLCFQYTKSLNFYSQKLKWERVIRMCVLIPVMRTFIRGVKFPMASADSLSWSVSQIKLLSIHFLGES